MTISTSVRVRGIKKMHPATFARVRAACQWAADGIDLDEHAAAITLTAEIARARNPRLTTEARRNPSDKDARRASEGTKSK